VRGVIAIAGSLAQRPGHGGHAWVFLQYLLGFRRLGFEVLFLDRLDANMCVDRQGRACRFEDSENRRYLLQVMQRFGLEQSFSLDFNRGEFVLGIPRCEVLARIGGAVLINVMGYLDEVEILGRAGQRVFLDIDPGFGQMWQALGLCRMFHSHDQYVTIGLNIGGSNCAIPTCGINWITTPQPIVLEHWPTQPVQSTGRFTSIVSWRGPFGPVEYNGKTYGLRAHEFRKLLELPRETGQQFELALDIDPPETADLDRLSVNGWSLVDPRTVAAEPWNYQRYIQQSLAEFMVAKEMYVKANSGWISDRSICYLASGKPVLAQDTHFGHLLPTGEGLLLFSSLPDAAAGVEKISRDYDRHARVARRLAEEHFDSDQVLGRLLGKLGVPS
jgi:hypothetical protein